MNQRSYTSREYWQGERILIESPDPCQQEAPDGIVNRPSLEFTLPLQACTEKKSTGVFRQMGGPAHKFLLGGFLPV
ncbi:MAG: hypothetical protein JSU72_19470 [Deltaproteobacteria bacterium]|nr:MAG: hypothetical protein JSU72_19470 [Deltaproteobacteria bacterium]